MVTMKILYVNNAQECSGCEDHLVDISSWLKEHGVEPAFLLKKGGMLEKTLNGRGIRSYPVFEPGNKVSLIARIASALRVEQPEVISINREHNILPLQISSLLARPFLRCKPKMVAVFHSPTGRWYPGIARFDGIIGTSEYTLQPFIKANPGIERISKVIYCGSRLGDPEPGLKFTRARPRKFFMERPFPLIGMVGELWKNQEELVEIAPLLIERFPEITIAIIGGYTGTEALSRKISKAKLDSHFILTGRVPRERIPDVFFDLDLSVSTHRNEGFGIVHIESLAAYTPVVAYNSGGLVEIIRKGGGMLVDGGIPEFARAVSTVLEDDDRRYALGREGRRVAGEHFSIDAMGRNHLQFYENLVKRWM